MKQIVIEIPEGLEERFIKKFEEAVRRLELIVFSEILKDILINFGLNLVF